MAIKWNAVRELDAEMILAAGRLNTLCLAMLTERRVAIYNSYGQVAAKVRINGIEREDGSGHRFNLLGYDAVDNKQKTVYIDVLTDQFKVLD